MENAEKKGILLYRIIGTAVIFCALLALVGRACVGGISIDVEIPENEDPSIVQLSYANTAGTNNKFPRGCRKHAGIKNPSYYKEFYKKKVHKPWLLFINGTATEDFDEFKERTMNFFQPKAEVCTGLDDSTCDELRKINVAIWLSQSALGAYQVRLDWLGQYLDDWDDPLRGRQNDEKAVDAWIRNYDNGAVDWKKNFKLIYEFINSQALQVQASNGHILSCCNDYKGDLDDIGECYYSGSDASLSWGSIKGQAGGHGSIFGYGRKSSKCFKRRADVDEMNCEDDVHLNIMRFCIWGIEGGGKKGRKNKYSLKPHLLKKWDKRGVIFDADEIKAYEPPE